MRPAHTYLNARAKRQGVILVVFLLLGVHASAQYTEQQLFEAYQRRDISLWQAYIDSQAWEELSGSDKRRRLRYEYGYAAALMDIDKRQAVPYIRAFGEHTNAMRDSLPEALYHVYRAAYETYDLAITSQQISAHRKAIYAHADSALLADSLAPMSWVIQGNIYFFAPRMLGGNKQKALEAYEKADALFSQDSTYYATYWEWWAEKLNQKQCRVKLTKGHF